MEFLQQILAFFTTLGQPKIQQSTQYTAEVVFLDNRLLESMELSEYINKIKKPQGFTPVTLNINGSFVGVETKSDLLKVIIDSHPNLNVTFERPKVVVFKNGIASAYGLNDSEGNGPRTATGIFDPWNTMEASMPVERFEEFKLKKVFVRNLNNNKVVEVKITDNGPIESNQIDVQGKAAQMLGISGAYPGGPGDKVPAEVYILGPEPSIDEKLNKLFVELKK
jgi:hypothetical protein